MDAEGALREYSTQAISDGKPIDRGTVEWIGRPSPANMQFGPT
jgi:hypothetical protein